MRNYRASLVKWQTADPMGYPDGWNALAYCCNSVTDAVDLWGCYEAHIVILGEIYWEGLHVGTVLADCNHNPKSPSFSIRIGKLARDDQQKIVGNPDYDYDSSSKYNIVASFESENVWYDHDSDPFNTIVRWEYQIKLTITISENVTIQDPLDPEKTITITRSTEIVERQAVKKGTHEIPE